MTTTATSVGARQAMEQLNHEAGKLHIWLRTEANAPAQRPWFRETGFDAEGQIAAGRVGAAQLKPVAHHWRWAEISPYLDRIAEIARASNVSPIEFAERQQFLLTNPGLGGRLQVTSTIRCAVSIYNPGDVAPVHIHTPNASRTILSEEGGYTTIDGERCEAARGDLILTPNGTWHDHGNDGDEPVMWVDVLDFPLMEFLDCVWLDEAYPGETDGNARAQRVVRSPGLAEALRPRRSGARLCPASARLWARHNANVPLPRRRYPGSARPPAPRGGRSVRRAYPQVCQPGDGSLAVSDLGLSGAAAPPGRGDPVQARDREHALYRDRRRRRHGVGRARLRMAGKRHLCRAAFCVAPPPQYR
ncbi:MAG: cupin domain-containing protein [Alphaproteobacteria bacterium]|nr:cupin domain-containing protein [Alphaproteobacteria bacterium]